jgi:hypothetical protein
MSYIKDRKGVTWPVRQFYEVINCFLAPEFNIFPATASKRCTAEPERQGALTSA